MSYLRNDDTLKGIKISDLKKGIKNILKGFFPDEREFTTITVYTNDGGDTEITISNIPDEEDIEEETGEWPTTSEIEDAIAESRTGVILVKYDGRTNVNDPDAIEEIDKLIDEAKYIDEGLSDEKKIELRSQLQNLLYSKSNNHHRNNNNNNNNYNNNNNSEGPIEPLSGGRKKRKYRTRKNKRSYTRHRKTRVKNRK